MIRQKYIRKIGAAWGVLGAIALLGFAVFRLVPFVYELQQIHLQLWQILLLVAWSAVMVYSEGYKAFGQQFSPRVVARAQFLARKATWTRVIFAPLYCIGYFGAPKKRVITAYALAAGIIMLIILVHFVPQPGRGIIDSGVVLGLTYGILSLLYYSFRALQSHGNPIANPENS